MGQSETDQVSRPRNLMVATCKLLEVKLVSNGYCIGLNEGFFPKAMGYS
jgi:hypothetical protein